MYRVNKIAVIAMVVMTALFLTSSTVKNKKMVQIFYTQEGTPYVLRTVTKYTPNIAIGLGSGVQFAVKFNTSALAVAEYTSFQIYTQKRVIPVMFNASMQTYLDDELWVNIASPFFSMTRQTAMKQDYAKAASKMWPMVEMIMYTNNANYNYGIKYGQTVLSDSDFVEVTQGCEFHPKALLAEGLTHYLGAVFPGQPAGNYNFGLTFCYFELL